jgi:outer membrane receptor protein involved in Fe transport
MRHGTAFSFQPVSDLFTLRNNSDQLKPSETVNKEIGVKYDWNAQASITASVFDMSQTNIQVVDPPMPTSRCRWAARAHAAWNSASPVI